MILLAAAASAVGAVMALAVVLSLRPAALRATARFVCRAGETMDIRTSVHGHHRPGERSLEVYCDDYGKRRLVNGPALLTGFLMCFAVLLPFAGAAVWFVFRRFS